MKTGECEQLGQGLLSHLHLSAAQAAVILDASSSPERLLLYVYDQNAAKLPLRIKRWCGHPVEVHRVNIGVH
tara:strand:+ start:4486 stop:4701 length:216 start_codon:yes stop_codon:yes gene_type:complete